MKKSINKFVSKSVKNTKAVKGGVNGRGTRTTSGNTQANNNTKLL